MFCQAGGKKLENQQQYSEKHIILYLLKLYQKRFKLILWSKSPQNGKLLDWNFSLQLQLLISFSNNDPLLLEKFEELIFWNYTFWTYSFYAILTQFIENFQNVVLKLRFDKVTLSVTLTFCSIVLWLQKRLKKVPSVKLITLSWSNGVAEGVRWVRTHPRYFENQVPFSIEVVFNLVHVAQLRYCQLTN